jgi:hypothetical protein
LDKWEHYFKREKKLRKKSAAIIAALVTLLSSTIALPSSNEVIEGIWQGTLKAGVIELRIVFKIYEQSDGMLTATMDSPDQGAKDIPVDEVIFENGNLRLEIKIAMGVFEGKLKGDNLSIEGEWKQSGQSVPLVLERIDEVVELLRPQEPKEPYSYQEEEVIYENKEATVMLAGTLTIPAQEGPFPAVLLISGSGPQDRDETLFGHHPFLVLADYLTRRGIAVLRVDDRGVGESTGDFAQATSEDFASDVLAGVEYLKRRKEIDPKKIGLIGHSEGGIIAPMVAVQSSDVAFIILMAGSGLTGEEILYLQAALIARAEGASDEAIAKNLSLQEQMFTVLKEEPDDAIAEKRLRTIFENTISELELSEKEKEIAEANAEAEIQRVLSPWFRYFLTYDPRPTLMKVKSPVLAINGEKDLQVPPKENLAAIEEALKLAGNNNYTIKELSGLNHLFQTAHTGSLSEYARIEETISPTALEIMSDWILEQTR